MKKMVLEGKIHGNERGYGFFIPNDENLEDFFVSHSDMRGAMHGDVVLAECNYSGKDRTFARVIKVLERGYTEIVGTYFSTRTGGFVCPDDKKYFNDIFIKGGRGLYASSGQKVVCKILSYPHRKNPEGIITEILGKQFTRQAEVKSIIRTYGLSLSFSEKVIKQANDLQQPTEQELIDRQDFTKLNCFTIDGDDSRDFDDAVSIKRSKNGDYILGVHIADVTHYVKEGSLIDIEAYSRGTSTYFPENVIPMLPEKLSNDLCSLKSGVVRLTLSCMITIDRKGIVKSSKIQPSYIKSRARLTYNQVLKMFDGDQAVIKQFANVYDDLILMDELASLLTKKRAQNGYVDLDVKESAIYVKNGKIEICSSPRDRAHALIEEFMILANVCVATQMTSAKIPFIYRIHTKPDETKYSELLDFIKGLGIKVAYSEEITTTVYQKILQLAEDSQAKTVINRVMLRSMQKAKYSSVNRGHFGLGEQLYCHFTSPIRRYPDLYIHRLIKDFLNNGERFVTKKYFSECEKVAKHSSEMEKNSMEAERSMDDYYKMLYISDYVAEEFEGIISGVTSFGIFVELPNGIEGLVKIETLKGKFELDQKNYVLYNGSIKYKLGERVRIVVAGVDISSRKAEFLLCDNNTCKNTRKRVL